MKPKQPALLLAGCFDFMLFAFDNYQKVICCLGLTFTDKSIEQYIYQHVKIIAPGMYTTKVQLPYKGVHSGSVPNESHYKLYKIRSLTITYIQSTRVVGSLIRYTNMVNQRPVYVPYSWSETQQPGPVFRKLIRTSFPAVFQLKLSFSLKWYSQSPSTLGNP